MYANYFYDTSVFFDNSIIYYREPFTICIGHDRRTDVIDIDCDSEKVKQKLICFHNYNLFHGSGSDLDDCYCVACEA